LLVRIRKLKTCTRILSAIAAGDPTRLHERRCVKPRALHGRCSVQQKYLARVSHIFCVADNRPRRGYLRKTRACLELMEEVMVKVTHLTRTDNAKSRFIHYDTTILLTWVALSIAFVIVVYLAFRWPGTVPEDFALMTVFP
jgi:hypothetical protein